MGLKVIKPLYAPGLGGQRANSQQETVRRKSQRGEFCRRTDAAVGHLPRLVRVVDDMLTFADDFESHTEDVRQILFTCRKNNIT